MSTIEVLRAPLRQTQRPAATVDFSEHAAPPVAAAVPGSRGGLRRHLLDRLRAAQAADERLSGKERAEVSRIVGELREIRREVATRARELGYARRCQEAIAVCNGECCRWQFPKDLGCVDFFIAIWGLRSAQREELTEQIDGRRDREDQCPLLTEDGCFLSFEDRPMVCANAYPCFVEQGYWNLLEEKRSRVNALYADLRQFVDPG